jgi:asparagine synthase (glutamine-hydrolysing)
VEKYVFKKAVEPLLPREVVYRKKAGMGVPLNQWFRHTALLGYATDLLHSKRATERGLFAPAFVDALLRGDGPESYIGQDRSGELLWMLMSIELWYRVFVDGEGA